ncbi:hypothetical protein LTR35_012939 [Friedmanniomyces endolithicus]|nr:hypothetical protein LTR35_012939 [Friedmanniomyces endolithicus]KAK0285498.1 hypothetical protein LTS00_010859 [Friedmanniomyces endolithicus]KAK0977825.1 hypothetical protein LTR54_016063 [Friedmanniomyces endolithicus]KAK1060849.1 hypothetical protein LTR74_011540 [Friedmanniomyces endolithicus]
MKTTTASLLTTTTLLLSTVSAQQETYSIDPNAVSNATRQVWCTSQQAQCPLICLQTANDASTQQNACDPTQLTYACICGNGLSPNISEYSQTLPFFLCQEWGNECVANCNGDNLCQSNCRSQHPCGAQNPTRQNTSTLSMSSSTTQAGGSQTSGGGAGATTSGVFSGFAGASSTGGAAASGSAGGAASSATKASAAANNMRAAVLDAGRAFGLLGVVGLMFGGFAVLL